MVRGSAVNRLRPVGSTSVRPRAGAPAGPALTWRPSSAASSACASRPSALCRAQRIGLAAVRAAVDVQPVLDGEILEVAEPGVDAAQRLVGRVGPRRRPRRQGRSCRAVSTISLASRSRRRRSRPSAWAYSSTSRSSSCCVLVKPGAGQRRRQMAERDGGDAPLGLRRLAGVADDEGIDDGQRAGDDLGKQLARQRHVLPGSHSSVPCAPTWTIAWTPSALLQPEAEGDQCVARRQRWIVIVGAAVGGAAAVRRQRHGDVAESAARKGNAAVRRSIGIRCSGVAPGSCLSSRRGWTSRRAEPASALSILGSDRPVGLAAPAVGDQSRGGRRNPFDAHSPRRRGRAAWPARWPARRARRHSRCGPPPPG